jgi:Sec-independent protein translocase protein TatA
MEILGIGPSELLFIVVLALIILGPREMQKTGRTIGKWLRQVVTSDGWKFFQQTSREIQTLPNRLMRDAALEELKEMDQDLRAPVDGAMDVEGAGKSGQSSPSLDAAHVILPSPNQTTPSGDQQQDA